MKGLLFAAAFLASFSLGGNVADSNYQISTSSTVLHDIGFNGVKLTVGSGQEKSSDSLFFFMDISHDFTMVGDSKQAGWGVVCDEQSNSCKVEDPATQEDFYNAFLVKYQKASAFARVNPGQKLTTEGVSKLNIRLMTGGQKWFLDSYGVVGLTPQGDFANYLRGVYEKDTAIAIKYKLKTPANRNERLAFDGYAVQNPTYNETDILFSTSLPKEEKFWTLKGDLSFPDSDYIYKGIRFCLTTISSEIIQVMDALVFNRKIQETACGGKYWNECNKSTADLKKLPLLSITFEKTVFSFTPEEYTYFDNKGILTSRIGDIQPMRSDRQCPIESEFGLGKLFFQKFIPMFTFVKDGSAKLSFLNKLEVQEPKSSIWLYIALGGAIISIAVILVILLKWKAPSDDEYAQAD